MSDRPDAPVLQAIREDLVRAIELSASAVVLPPGVEIEIIGPLGWYPVLFEGLPVFMASSPLGWWGREALAIDRLMASARVGTFEEAAPFFAEVNDVPRMVKP